MANRINSLRRVPAIGALAERETGGFLVLAALVGVGVGLMTAGLVLGLEAVSHLLGPAVETGDGAARSWLIFLTAPTGFFLAWWLAQSFAPEVSGDGVPAATEALLVRGGHIRRRVAPLKLVATALTLGGGGSAGREGPIVQIGSAVGSWVARRFNVGEDQVRSLVAAGAGAAIGASFNAPIAGMLFALEVILVSLAPRHMSAIVIASVTAAVTSQQLVGEELALNAGAYSLGSFAELPFYGVLALVVLVVGFVFLRLLDRVEAFVHDRGERWSAMRPVGFGLAVAGLIYLAPSLYGTGQEVTNSLLLDEQVVSITGSGGELWWVLLLLALGKAVATSLTIGSGGSGGAFMPSLFMGAAVGTAFARFAQEIPGVNIPLQTGAFAVVGMAAMFAVVGRAPLTAILIVFEVTGARDYGLILPLMLTATLATFLADRFIGDSVYTMALKRRGIRLTRSGEVDVLDTVTVGSVMAPSPFLAHSDQTLAEVETMFHRHRAHGVPVVDGETLTGVITSSDIARAIAPTDEALVGDVMTPRPVTVSPSTPVSVALERMAALGVGRLPVVSDDDPRQLVGLFRREEAVRAYHEGLSSSTDHHLERLRLAQRTEPGAGYFDFRVPAGSVADGRAVREVPWPEGSTLVSVRREREVLVPDGETLLLSGDVVTAFGTVASRERLIERLNSGALEQTAEIPLEELWDDADLEGTTGHE